MGWTITSLLMLPACACAFSTTPYAQCWNSPSGTSSATNENVYWNQYSASQQIDQAAYGSSLFWKQVGEAIPGWSTSSKYERFRGFCNNLRTETPGKDVFDSNGQQLLAQYVFPGLDHESVVRKAYPADDYRELRQLRDKLQRSVRPIAQREFSELIEARPLVGDDDELEVAIDNDGNTWQRAAWYGWQYLSLRGAKRWMPKTSVALQNAMKTLGPAHRFVGLTRQKHNCTGVVHSDGRNYMLSTLTPVLAPKEGCGIVVDGVDAAIVDDPIILDNTFRHHVYNNHATMDRFCLMSECYHPALTFPERDAIATLFAVKDRFTVEELQLAPWGYDDDDLAAALKTGAVHDLDYWKDVNYNPRNVQLDIKSSSSNKKRKKATSGRKPAKGFGQADNRSKPR